MYLPPKEKKKLTIGKILRNNKGIRKRDPDSKEVEMPQ